MIYGFIEIELNNISNKSTEIESKLYFYNYYNINGDEPATKVGHKIPYSILNTTTGFNHLQRAWLL